MFSSLLSHRPLNTHLFVQFSSCSVQFVTHAHDDATLSKDGRQPVRTAYRTHKTRDILLHVQPYEHTTCLSIPNPNCTSLYVYHTRVASTYRRAPPYALLPPSSLTTVMPKCWRVSSFTSSGYSVRMHSKMNLRFMRRVTIFSYDLTPPTRLPLLRRART